MGLLALQWIDLFASTISIIIEATCAISLSRRKHFSPVIKLTQILIVLDFVDLTLRSIHDFSVSFEQDEFFALIFVKFVVFVDTYRWYGGLILNTMLGIFYVISINWPVFFRRITKVHVYLVVVILSIPSLVILMPVVVNDGFRFYIPGYYWNYDFTRVPQTTYKTIDTTLQVLCIFSMFIAFICLFFHLRKLPKSLKTTATRLKRVTRLTSTPATVSEANDEPTVMRNVVRITNAWQKTTTISSTKHCSVYLDQI